MKTVKVLLIAIAAVSLCLTSCGKKNQTMETTTTPGYVEYGK